MDSINVALLGLGNVGRGTFEVLQRNQAEIARRAGRSITITVVAARRPGHARTIVGDAAEIVADAHNAVARPDIDVVIEAIGGCELARELVLTAIENGKHVVTANKALLAVHGTEIFAAAARKGVIVAYEGSVAGGIPIVKALREGLVANRVDWVAGIINGTTNYILSEMRDKGLDFETVLKEAQALGYAEADPSFDIDGIDAAHKITLLGAIAFGIPVQFDKVYVEGITQLHRPDIRYAEQLGYRIKLLGVSKRTEQGVELRVHPTLIPTRRLITSVEGPMNAVVVKGDAVGTTLYYGQGAGAEPTASAVIADLVDIARLQGADAAHQVPALAYRESQENQQAALAVLPMDEVVTSYYLRARVVDQAGVLATITGMLADAGISVDALLQRESDEVSDYSETDLGKPQTDLIILTHETREGTFNQALAKIQQLPSVLGDIVRIRKEELA